MFSVDKYDTRVLSESNSPRNVHYSNVTSELYFDLSGISKYAHTCNATKF